MLKCLKIADSELSNVVTIAAESDTPGNSTSCSTLDSAVVLACTTNKTYDEWYDAFLEKKRNVIRFGGEVTVDGRPVYTGHTSTASAIRISTGGFDAAATGTDECPMGLSGWKRYLRELQGTKPDNSGAISILSDKYVDILSSSLIPVAWRNFMDTVADNSIGFIRSPGFFNPNKHYKRLLQMELLLYDSINYQADRLRIGEWDVSNENSITDPGPGSTVYNVVPNPLPAGFGPRLDTIRNYQAIVAHWNHNAWNSSMVMDIERLPGSASISLGYVALECSVPSVVITCTLSYYGLTNISQDVDPEEDDDVSSYSNNYTIYHTGTDRGVSPDTNTEWSAFRNGTDPCNGTGYLGGSAGNKMQSATIKIEIGEMMAEQYHYETFAISVPTAALEYYEPQEKIKYVHRYNVETTWKVHGRLFTKNAILDVPAVNVVDLNDDDPDNPDNPVVASTVEYGVLTDDGRFQPLDLSGASPEADGEPYSMETDVTIYKTGEAEPNYGESDQ